MIFGVPSIRAKIDFSFLWRFCFLPHTFSTLCKLKSRLQGLQFEKWLNRGNPDISIAYANGARRIPFQTT